MKMHRWLILPAILVYIDVHAAEHSKYEDVIPKTISASHGIIFSCNSNSLNHIQASMAAYLTTLGISNDLVVRKIDEANGLLTFTLNTPSDDTNTLRLKSKPEYAIKNSTVLLPSKNGEMRSVVTVSKKRDTAGTASTWSAHRIQWSKL